MVGSSATLTTIVNEAGGCGGGGEGGGRGGDGGGGEGGSGGGEGEGGGGDGYLTREWHAMFATNSPFSGNGRLPHMRGRSEVGTVVADGTGHKEKADGRAFLAARAPSRPQAVQA